MVLIQEDDLIHCVIYAAKRPNGSQTKMKSCCGIIYVLDNVLALSLLYCYK